tara:strand:+ start:22713 stop:22982 length:270 start_codon:yes stop_codon:yes gene_type:complete
MKKFALLLTALCLVALSGCNTGPTTAQRENMLNPNEGYNFFGIVKSEQGTFKRPGLTTADVSVNDVTTRDNYSGDSVTLLWGLITLRDY